jgi:aryl-alcohol dehydrogenase-like predicted oxidoreductase
LRRLRALDDLVTEGKVRYIGCANYAGYSLVESLWAADRLQTHRYESVQLQWSLVQRSTERELIPAAAAFGLSVANESFSTPYLRLRSGTWKLPIGNPPRGTPP